MSTEWMLYGAVAIFSFAQSARNFCENGLVMEICGDGERPIYMGLRNGLLAPFFAASSIIGGILTDWLGFKVVVIMAIPFTIIGGIINWAMVKPGHGKPDLKAGR
jgi:hypothetical protein